MESDERVILRKGILEYLPGTDDRLEYLGIENNLLSFNFRKPNLGPCKVLIPLERIDNRKNPINILKYQFLISELAEEEVTLKYLCPNSRIKSFNSLESCPNSNRRTSIFTH